MNVSPLPEGAYVQGARVNPAVDEDRHAQLNAQLTRVNGAARAADDERNEARAALHEVLRLIGPHVTDAANRSPSELGRQLREGTLKATALTDDQILAIGVGQRRITELRRAERRFKSAESAQQEAQAIAAPWRRFVELVNETANSGRAYTRAPLPKIKVVRSIDEVRAEIATIDGELSALRALGLSDAETEAAVRQHADDFMATAAAAADEFVSAVRTGETPAAMLRLPRDSWDRDPMVALLALALGPNALGDTLVGFIAQTDGPSAEEKRKRSAELEAALFAAEQEEESLMRKDPSILPRSNQRPFAALCIRPIPGWQR